MVKEIHCLVDFLNKHACGKLEYVSYAIDTSIFLIGKCKV